MGNKIYTIGREFGSAGYEVGKLLADRLQIKLYDKELLALTNGAPSKASEMLALNIYNTFYGRTGYEGVGQAKAVIFFIIVTIIAMVQNRLTTSKEVQQ